MDATTLVVVAGVLTLIRTVVAAVLCLVALRVGRGFEAEITRSLAFKLRVEPNRDVDKLPRYGRN